MPESYELSRDECVRLLAAGVAGRIAVVAPDGPHIVPVNYSVVDGDVIVRTTPYSMLGTHGRDAVLAFEVDQFDHEYHRGWSVQVRGRAEVVDDPDEREHVQAVWPPHPWASGARTLFVRLACDDLTGRRLGQGWDLFAALPVHRGL